MRRKIRVGILFGGRSAEHEVSLQSAENIIDAIDKKKYEPVPIGITKEGRWITFGKGTYLQNKNDPKAIRIKKSLDRSSVLTSKFVLSRALGIGSNQGQNLDVIFPVLHGPYGEDGTVQGLLKLAQLPFVGASVLGSAIGMDKDVMKRLLREAGIRVADFITLNEYEFDTVNYKKIISKLGLPLFVKPANLGSSVGVSKVITKRDLEKAIRTAFLYDRKILLESYVKGREIECAVLGNEMPIASVAGEVIPKYDFYSYSAKYLDENGAELVIPANVSLRTLKSIQDLAVKTFKVLNCEGMARVDFFLSEKNKLVVNEINAIPGFTKISMYPKLWQASGISYPDLIDRLIGFAVERFEKEQKLKMTVD